jgi:tripartite-type tricarboxylate transporter receptor subunit TctC
VAFPNISIGSRLLNIDSEYVLGYKSSRDFSMAVIRGDLDIVAIDFESVVDRLEDGDLRPLMQVAADDLAKHPALEGVPLLGGAQGLAARRAAAEGRNVAEAVADAAALISLLRTGRMVVAPAGLDANLCQCLEEELYAAVTDPVLSQTAREARRTIDIAGAADVRKDILAVMEKAERLSEILSTEVKKVRE